MAKESVSLRLEREHISLLKKIAKEEYGSDSKKGYVVETALQVYQAHRLRPTEAASILSVTEEKLIDRLDKRFKDIGKDIVERIGNLTAKNAYENCLTSLLVEDVHQKSGFNKVDYEQKRKEAAARMRNRFDKEGAQELAGVIEENEHLQKVNRDVQERLQRAAVAFEQFKQRIQQLESENEKLKQENQRREQQEKLLQEWANGLANHLINNYSRLKNNATLIEEYTNSNPVPRG
ncbi:hypothetical protein [Ectobacillus funiculus]|uniref:Mobilization protein n=1 Tax=Ectobacillus funiculus TaxID=137993 RepID=A0ABV5W9E3_9BACI